MTLTTTAAFHAAIASGDLETIQAYSRQLNFRTIVEETEAQILSLAETQSVDVTQLTLRDDTLPWFRRLATWHRNEDAVPLVDAARRGAVDVIEWIFSCENARRMGATLALLFPLVAQFRRRRFKGEQNRWLWPRPSARDPLVLEALVTSHVFCEHFTDDQRQRVLDDIAGQTDNPAMLEVAIAHGARLQTAASVAALYGSDALCSDASFLMGADVLIAPSCFWKHADADDSFIVGGADWATDRLARALTDTAAALDYEALETALTDGFVDVDARDVDGRTSLMHWANVDTSDPYRIESWRFAGNPPQRMAEILLDTYSADLALVDNNRRSALHYARNNKTVAMLLLKRGANPTVPDHFGVMAFDWMVEKVYEWYEWREIIELCLARGADPYERRPRPLWNPEAVEPNDAPLRSLYDRLNEYDRGKAFITVQFFRHSSLSR